MGGQRAKRSVVRAGAGVGEMPIERAVFTNTDPLKPHAITQGASDAHTAHKYLPPGPGAYDDSKVDPAFTYLQTALG